MVNSIPTISVVMPLYNAQSTIGEAIESILKQTFSDFELVVIDDASTDDSAALIQSFDDPRVRYFRNDVNLRVAETLNRALSLSRGEYIARMDADDISLPDRLAKQLDFLQDNPEISICGTFAEVFGARTGQIIMPTEPDMLHCHLIFDTCFAHPTVMFRREDFLKNNLKYPNVRHMEDLELWYRVLSVLKGANIPEKLLRYRVLPNSAYRCADPKEIRDQYRLLDIRSITDFGIAPGPDELEVHHAIRRIVEQPYNLDLVEKWLLRLLDANNIKHLYNSDALIEYFGRLWFIACYHHPGLGLLKLHHFRTSKLFSRTSYSQFEFIKFLVRYRRKLGS